MNYNLEFIKKAGNILEVNFIKEINKAKTFKEAKELLEKIKRDIKKSFRKKSKELHPDMGKEKNDEKFKELCNAYKFLMKLKIIRPKPKPLILYYNLNNFYDTNTATTATNMSMNSSFWSTDG